MKRWKKSKKACKSVAPSKVKAKSLQVQISVREKTIHRPGLILSNMLFSVSWACTAYSACWERRNHLSRFDDGRGNEGFLRQEGDWKT